MSGLALSATESAVNNPSRTALATGVILIGNSKKKPVIQNAYSGRPPTRVK
jgi:hypothetical protein